MKDKEVKPRNWVKKWADEFTKPSRFRDKKHDYVRKGKHPVPADEAGGTVLKPSEGRELEKYVREHKDWLRNYEEEQDYLDSLEHEKDTPPTGEV